MYSSKNTWIHVLWFFSKPSDATVIKAFCCLSWLNDFYLLLWVTGVFLLESFSYCVRKETYCWCNHTSNPWWAFYLFCCEFRFSQCHSHLCLSAFYSILSAKKNYYWLFMGSICNIYGKITMTKWIFSVGCYQRTTSSNLGCLHTNSRQILEMCKGKPSVLLFFLNFQSPYCCFVMWNPSFFLSGWNFLCLAVCNQSTCIIYS